MPEVRVFGLLLPAIGIAIIHKISMVTVLIPQFIGMFDRTTILFGSSGNFTNIGNNAGGVSSKYAIQLFVTIKIGKVPVIQENIISAANHRNIPGTKTYRLKYIHAEIKKNQRDDHSIDKR